MGGYGLGGAGGYGLGGYGSGGYYGGYGGYPYSGYSYGGKAIIIDKSILSIQLTNIFSALMTPFRLSIF